MTREKIDALAAEGSACFTTAERADGTEYVVKTDGAPDWITELLHATHDDARILPDDYRYRWTWDALTFLHYDGGDMELDDAAHEFADQVTPYNAERFAWLASNLERQGYVDDAYAEFGGDFQGVAQLVALGMYAERREVFDAVAAFLTERAS